MSLEDKIAAHIAATEALTDAIQHLAATIRSASSTAPIAPPPTAFASENKPAGKGPGRPKKDTPPPAPLAETATPPAQVSAQAADAGSDPLDLGSDEPEDAEPVGTYEDLQKLVPAVAEKNGRARALAIFSGMGFPGGGKELQAKAPERIPEAVKLFRAEL